MAYKMKGFSGFKPETKASPNKFLGKFMRNTGVGKTLGKAAKYGAFGPLGMAAAAAGGAYKKKGAGSVPQHGDEAHGGGQSQEAPQGAAEQVAKQQEAVQGGIPTDAPAATGTQEQAPTMKRGMLTKGKEKLWKKANVRPEPDYEGGDTTKKSGAVRRGQQELNIGPFNKNSKNGIDYGSDVEGNPPDLKYSMEKVQQGPMSKAEERRVKEKIIELEDRIEFVVTDVDNDRVDREKGFKRIRQLEKQIKELEKTV